MTKKTSTVQKNQNHQLLLQETVKKTQSLSRSSERYKKLVNAISQFIARDLQPISVVDGEGFKHLMEVADPSFVVPSHTYLTNTLLPSMYAEVQQKGPAGFVSYPLLLCHNRLMDFKATSLSHATK